MVRGRMPVLFAAGLHLTLCTLSVATIGAAGTTERTGMDRTYDPLRPASIGQESDWSSKPVDIQAVWKKAINQGLFEGSISASGGASGEPEFDNIDALSKSVGIDAMLLSDVITQSGEAALSGDFPGAMFCEFHQSFELRVSSNALRDFTTTLPDHRKTPLEKLGGLGD